MTRVRWLLCVLAVALVCAGLASVAVSAAANSGAIKSCGRVSGTVFVGSRGVRCHTARRVARAYLNGNHHPLGFRCRRIAVNAAAGWTAKCTRRSRLVDIVPE